MKRTLLTLFQLLITAAMVWWVFRDPDKRAEIASTLVRADTQWLMLGIASYGVVEIIATLRWQWLLRVQDIRLSFRRLLGLTMIGVFFNFIIPGGTGGDAVKIFYLVKETPGRRSTALLSVLFDRLIGLFALIVLAAGLIAWKWDWLFSVPETAKWIYLALTVLGACLSFIVVSFAITGLGLVHRLPAKLPGRDKLAEMALAYNVYGRAWRPSLAGFSISFLAHIGYYGVFYCAIRALASSGMEIPTLAEFYAIMPIIGTITSLPLSVGGVGWREMLFETFFGGLCSASGGVAVAVSSAGYLMTLFWGLLGGLIYVLYRPTDHARLPQIRREVRALEHEVAEEEIALETHSDQPPVEDSRRAG